MKKIDVRCLSSDAQKEYRRQALRLRTERGRKENARVVGVHIGTVIRWGQRFGREGKAGLKSKQRGRRYLTGRTLALTSRMAGAFDFGGGNAGATEFAGCAVEPAGEGMELIERLFGLTMPIRTVGEYLLRWDYTPWRPLEPALEHCPTEVWRWLKARPIRGFWRGPRRKI